MHIFIITNVYFNIHYNIWCAVVVVQVESTPRSRDLQRV